MARPQSLPFHRFACGSERGSWEFLIAPPLDLAGIVESASSPG